MQKHPVVARYAEIIHHLNSRIAEFNTYLKNDMAFPQISTENPATYTDAMTSDWGDQGWPSKDKRGVYVFCCAHEDESGKLGVYIGKASMREMGHRMYHHLKPFRETGVYKRKAMNAWYIVEAILAVPIEDNSAGCLASALEEFLIAGGVSGAVLMNSVGVR